MLPFRNVNDNKVDSVNRKNNDNKLSTIFK